MSPIIAVPKPTGQPAARVMFLYWGRRGAMPQFTLELGRAALVNPAIEATICVSRQNEMFPAYAEIGSAVYPVTTFATHLGAAFQSWRLPLICRQLTAYLTSHRIEAVVDLMPHVWSPLITHAIRASGARYVPVLHDAVPHPGDPTTWVKRHIDRSLRDADLIVTLSASVAASVRSSGAAPQADIITLFHPDFAFGPARTHQPPQRLGLVCPLLQRRLVA